MALSRSLDNAIEREIRAMVMGKNPERWLAYVLDHISNTKDEDLYKLLPEFWEDIK